VKNKKTFDTLHSVKDWDIRSVRKSYKFCIVGNQENANANPIPYHRTTQGSFWNKGSKRYKAWKEYVVDCCIEQLGIRRAELMEDALKWKPFTTTKENRARMDIVITFTDFKHSDSDNVFKGIADALFVQDKFLSGSFDFKYGKIGSVTVLIQEVGH
jgi:hypothetical protein